jgi:2-C-methyl-D-erythritol 4-phosphate cytidylyltransferase/2-C-methyl-D-erythritol 2,4-cyclodiphosphate synthase
MKVSAIIPAGGAGTRIKSKKAKQYLSLGQIPILIRTLNVFERIKIINEIILVVPKNDLFYIQKELLPPYKLTKIKSVVAGGNARQDSVKNGLKEVSDKTDIVVIHDAVRPFIREKMISAVVSEAKKTGAATVGVMSKDTIKIIKRNNLVSSTIPRNNVWLTQTPQAFKYEVLKKAYEKAHKDKFHGTDDASLVERIGQKVKMVEGSYGNIKITTPEDIIIAKALMKNKHQTKSYLRVGLGCDSHRFVTGPKLILGGLKIPSKKGLQGHSDADALIHAICDALLGAAGLPDIGRQFPDNDPKYKNISSMILLKKVKKMLADNKYSVVNIDATVILEKPKISAYSETMVSNIAGVLSVSQKNVSIKAKTNEGMGFIGKSEGIAVFAIATVIKNEE